LPIVGESRADDTRPRNSGTVHQIGRGALHQRKDNAVDGGNAQEAGVAGRFGERVNSTLC
jgi:hypothetical protein